GQARPPFRPLRRRCEHLRAQRTGRPARHDIDPWVPGKAHAAPGQRGEEWRTQTGRSALSRVPLSLQNGAGRRRSRHPSLSEGGTAAADDPAGNDAAELGAVHYVLYGQHQPLRDRVDVPLPALYAGSGTRTGCHRCPYPPPGQGDRRPTTEAATLSLPAPEGQRRQLQSCRRLRVLRKRSMGKVKPPGNDESIPTVLVRQTDGLAQSPVARPQPAAGLGPARAGILTYQSKEPDA